MKRFFINPKARFNGEIEECKEHKSIVGSWRLLRYSTHADEEAKPYWREVWTFAAMDEAERNGIYVCDYINLHTLSGKWALNDNILRLSRREYNNEYIVAELSSERLILEPNGENLYKSILFERTK